MPDYEYICTGRDDCLRQEEIERLRAAIAAALDEHDQAAGRYAPTFMPDHWTHKARVLLAKP